MNMGPGPGRGPGGPNDLYDKMKPPKPKHLREVPAYLRTVVGGVFSRLLYIFRLVWEARPALLFVMSFMALFDGFMPVAGTFISAHLLGRIVARLSDPTVDLWMPLLLQFGYTFLYFLVNNVYKVVMNISGELVTNHVRVKIMEKAKEVDLASFDQPEFYERLENASREAGTRPVTIVNSTFGMVSQIITMASYLVVLSGLIFRLAWYASTFALLFILLSVATALVGFYFRRQRFLYVRRKSKDRRQMNYYSDLMVNKDLVKELRLFDLSDLFIGRYKGVFARYFKGLKRLVYKETAWNLSLGLLTVVVNCVLFFIIASNIGQIEGYTIYTGALNAVSTAVTTVLTTIGSIYEGTLFIDNMILFMREKKTIRPTLPEGAVPERRQGHRIELRNVSFAYPGSDRMVLKHIDLTLEPGDTAVLVGLNGAGKTTLIKLLTRLYDPTEGTVLLDGRDIREYEPEALYRLYGIIFQDFGKYAEPVRDNIYFGQADAEPTDEALENAAKEASADEFIRRLPRGYDTPLMRYFEPDGVELSIGQWQKLSVARAFYADSDILILDEPTASLDPMAEQELFRQFDRLRKGKTTVFVSHRLSSAATADKIILLKDGEIAETGTHAELMAKKGEYYTLFTTQAKRYLSPNDPEPSEDTV